MTWIWLIVTVLSVLLEAATAAIVAIWFMPGGAICIILSLFGVNPILQIVIYFLVAAVMLVLSRTILKKYIQRGKPVPTNSDRLIGMNARVTEKIDNGSFTGAVKIAGQEWSARSTDSSLSFDIGETVTVSSIEGVKLICSKSDNH